MLDAENQMRWRVGRREGGRDSQEEVAEGSGRTGWGVGIPVLIV